ncbi:MAG: hypothetical protein GVY09_03735 [Gammaproteobacteria bacterium]|nr:hypothetical protein [Gammaproteobacteria bacterium]
MAFNARIRQNGGIKNNCRANPARPGRERARADGGLSRTRCRAEFDVRSPASPLFGLVTIDDLEIRLRPGQRLQCRKTSGRVRSRSDSPVGHLQIHVRLQVRGIEGQEQAFLLDPQPCGDVAARVARGFNQSERTVCEHIQHAADRALAADMLAILPERFVCHKPGGRIAPVPPEGGAVESRLVWHPSRTSDLAHKWVRNQLTDYFQDTGSDTP